MALIKQDFSTPRFENSWTPLREAVLGVQQNATEAAKLKALQDQQDIDNAYKTTQLGFQQAEADRAARKDQELIDRKKAIADTASIQRNILSGDVGQQKFEGAMNTLASTPGYDTALAELNKQGLTGSAYNQEVDNLRDFYSDEIAATAAATGSKLEDFSKKYSAVNEASGYDGLKYNIADDTYKQRVYDNLAKTGLFTTEEALKEATARDSLVRTQTANSDNIKAMRKDLDTAEKNELDILKNTMERKHMSGGGDSGSGKGKDYTYKLSTKDVISDAEKDAGIFSISGTDLRKMFNEVNGGFKGKSLKPTDAQLAEAAYNASTGENDSWTKGDFDIKKVALESELAKIILRDGPSGSKGGSSSPELYSKFGPQYLSNAQAISAKYAEARKQLNEGAGGNLQGTGLAELEALYSQPTTSTKSSSNTSISKDIKKDTDKAITKIKDGKLPASEVTEEVSKSVKTVANSAQAKELGLTEGIVTKYADEYVKALNNPDATDAEIRSAFVEKYGAKWVGFLGDALGELLAVGGNAVVAIKNDSLGQKDKLDYFTSDDMLRGVGNLADRFSDRFGKGIDKIFGSTTEKVAPVTPSKEVDFKVLQDKINSSFKKNPDMDSKDVLNASMKLNKMSKEQQQLVFTAVQDPTLGITARLKMLTDAGLTTKEANEALGQVTNLR